MGNVSGRAEASRLCELVVPSFQRNRDRVEAVVAPLSACWVLLQTGLRIAGTLERPASDQACGSCSKGEPALRDRRRTHHDLPVWSRSWGILEPRRSRRDLSGWGAGAIH
jgi:hypothetical protein